MNSSKQKAFFFDRDGIINIDTSYVGKIEDFTFCDGIFDILSFLQESGYLLFIITNQSGIGRGYFSIDDYNKLNSYMLDELKKQNIIINEVKCCPHAPDDNCQCRKPNATMVNELVKKYNIDTNISWFVGDKTSDIDCGINANIKNTILVNPKGYNKARFNLHSFDLIFTKTNTKSISS